MSSILLVDDSNSITAGCKKMFEPLGHDIICLRDSREDVCLTMDVSSISLVIINSSKDQDYDRDTLRRLHLQFPEIPGVLVAERGAFDTLVEAMNCGFSKVCIKPLDFNDLKKAVIEVFKSSEIREEVTRMKAFLPLYRLGQKLLLAVTKEEVYDELAEIIRKEFNAPAVSVMMLDESTGTLKIVAHRGLKQQYVDSLEIFPGERIAGKVFQMNSPVILNRENQRETSYSSLLVRPELSAAISFPIASHNSVIGVINVSETESGRRFNDSDLEMLSIISDEAVMALGNIRAIKEREEQVRVRTLLEQYVSPEVSDMLVETRQDLMDVGNIQDLTVLFADIRNFTLLVQNVSPPQLRDFLNDFFELLTSVVFYHKGMLDKFMGDAALVVFGAPVSLKKPTIAALTVAIELVDQFKNLQHKWLEVHPVFKQISLGVGVTRGALFLGNIGSTKRVDYTVIGTEVNIAQRLASETNEGQILCTQQAHDDVGNSFHFDSLGPMLLRGMTSDVHVYKLLNIQTG